MDHKHTSVAQKLRAQREACALSQRQVAEALNIDRTTYTKYETGGSEPNLMMLVKIAKIFNVPPTALLPSPDAENDADAPLADSERVDTRVDSPIYQLSKDERALVAYFRALKRDEKQQAMETMANIAKNSTASDKK